MSSPKRKRARPIESVELKLTFKADGEALGQIGSRFPSAVLKHGACEVVVRGETPAEVAEKAKEILEFVREASRQSKGFK